MTSWYLIKTKSRQENIAAFNLENQNYRIFCPHAIINKKIVVLFPGYIFIQLDNNKQNWAPIRSTKGVVDFVRFGLSFAKVPDNIIEFIKVNQDTTAEKLKNLNNFQTGDSVQILDGAFRNCTAVFKSMRPNDRVILLINLLGQQQKINLKQKSLVRL